ncbi:hypothetical protein ACH0B5_00530 [Ureibacillus sp. 179-F W5.1 NHS]|uniref:hypothetical protein n=1 Tax=Ureibacillus sp. 179-F W5.1 NHS TaxID=3374297 RepID=UPI00387A3A0F
MSKIKVDIDRVNDLTPSFSQVATKVSNTTDKVTSIRSQIDYRIKARHGIGDQLYKISNELHTIEKNMQKLVSFLQNSMDKYATAEEKIARQVPMLPNVIGKNNITIDENGKIQVMNEYAQFNTDRPVDPNTGEYLFTYEGQRQVLGGNGSGTPDGLAQLGDLAYEFLFGDIETLFDPNASLSDKAIAAAFMLPIGKPLKAAKVAMDAVDNSKDIAKAVDKAENIKDLSKSVDKTKEIQDKTITDLEVKQLGEYIKNLEKKQVDKEKSPLNDPYIGVKQASEYLKSQGVPRQFRKNTLESFEIGTIRLDIAGSNTYGLRFYDNINAYAKGRYLFETFSPQVNRNNLALPPDWNRMTGIQQWQVKPDTIIIKGKAGPQFQMGDQYIGGVEQWYITNLDSLIKP